MQKRELTLFCNPEMNMAYIYYISLYLYYPLTIDRNMIITTIDYYNY